MLVLTRKSAQSIMIGDEIEITVLSVTGTKVRIGIAAPRRIPVFRKEIYLEIQAERASPCVPHPDAEPRARVPRAAARQRNEEPHAPVNSNAPQQLCKRQRSG